jgi:hypothetical protein
VIHSVANHVVILVLILLMILETLSSSHSTPATLLSSGLTSKSIREEEKVQMALEKEEAEGVVHLQKEGDCKDLRLLFSL